MACEGPVSEISLDPPVAADIVGGGTSTDVMYFCIVSPENAPTFTAKITGLTAILNLYVAYPDLETLQHGGITFWQSEALGTVDKTDQATPLGSKAFLGPGTTFIEVSPENFQDSSPFIPTVTAP
jgi:hypothetical protein